ncbi:EAL domain-containing protein [Aestuariicella sp. G3-2]|uniref:bifunctional diguanylate cyclase/phosphodiesterase n=1 Tax=Pseudomaricurvus albidus TaxID=2842452 RepID=UPI001C0BD27E|nr:EAL domain-containing protein [Aestuariicella albida]
MTLYRQLILVITCLIASIMAGNFVVSVINARDYVSQQMEIHAQDTATSLGLTISHAAKAKDEAEIRSFVDVVFDRGYYRQVTYRSVSGDMLVESKMPIVIEGVPNWFIQLIDLSEPVGHAEVISGWFRLGAVDVVSHPGLAYLDLWRVFKDQLWLFLFTSVFCYLLAGLGLAVLLRPLRQVEVQAEAICRREFPVQSNLPRTRELRRMVLAMNRMVQKIQSMFQEQVELSSELRRQANFDPVTELLNRSGFDAHLESRLSSERGGSAGEMVLIQLSGLSEFNLRVGRATGDQCLKGLAEALTESLVQYPDAILGRRTGTDLCAFIPLVDLEEGEAIAGELFSRLNGLSWFREAEELQLHMGVAFASRVTEQGSLLVEADLALRSAQSQGEANYQWHQVDSAENSRSASEWQELLGEALEHKRFTFHVQPVFERDGKTLSQWEVFCRLPVDGDLLAAGVFLPMAERFGMSESIDCLMIKMLAEQYTEARGPKVCVNLSPSSLVSETFLPWLDVFLRNNRAFAQRLVLELPGYSLATHEREVRSLALKVNELGSQLLLDHFGTGVAAFAFLQSLPLFALKVDRCFVNEIDLNADNRFFVQSLVQIAHSCDVKLLVEGVETEAEWSVLQSLGIDGGQGYYLGKPMALEYADQEFCGVTD